MATTDRNQQPRAAEERRSDDDVTGYIVPVIVGVVALAGAASIGYGVYEIVDQSRVRILEGIRVPR